MGTLSFERDYFIFRGTFKESYLPKEARFFFDGTVWKTTSVEKALKLKPFADPVALKVINTLCIKTREWSGEVKVPKGLKPYPFQFDGVRHLLTRNRSYLASDAGLGKTIMAILAMNSDPGPALIVCPPFLKINWVREIKKWGLSLPEPFVMNSLKDLTEETALSEIIVVPDSLIHRPNVQALLAKKPRKWLFIDEAHRFKTGTAKRTAALFGGIFDTVNRPKKTKPLFKYAENVVAMSGTPMPNRPMEMYPLLNALAPETIDFMEYHNYGVKFCAAYQGYHGWDYRGASNLFELRERLRSVFLIRHKKENVLKDLPPKTRQLIRLDESRTAQGYDQGLLKQYSMNEILGAVSENTHQDNKMLGELAKYRNEMAMLKTEAAISYLTDLLEETDKKIIVFAHHISVVEEIATALKKYGALKVRGGISNETRDAYVQEFQNNSQVRIIVGNIQAMGVGFTLTAASRVVFAEYSWVPGENSQAEDRANRIGQTKNILCQYLIASDLDEYILNAVMEKEKNIEKAGT